MEELNQERRVSRGADATLGAEDSDTGREPAENTNQQSAANNGFTNGSHNPTRVEEMHDHDADGFDHSVVRNDGASQGDTGLETTADEPMKDMIDDNDVIEEAAEDTVIY